jgi:hypothetical protein
MVCRMTAATLCVGSLIGVAHATAQESDRLAADEYGYEIRCTQPEHDARRLRGSARGVIRVTGRNLGSELELRGSIEVTLEADDGEPRTERVELEGTGNQDGTDFSTHAISETESAIDYFYFRSADEDVSSIVAFDPSPTATIPGGYYMNCGRSFVRMPRIRDLEFSYQRGGLLHLTAAQQAQIKVVNKGNEPIGPTTVRVSFGVGEAVGTLVSEDPADETILYPLQEGSIRIDLPKNTLQRCTTYVVSIDTDRAAQSALWTDQNDTEELPTPCLTWQTPLYESTLGFAPEPLIEGVTLEQIVNSEVVARTSDHRRCNECHYPGQPNERIQYMPAPGLHITPTTLVRGSWPDQTVDLAWGGGLVNNWAWQFQGYHLQPQKPEYLTRVFQLWREDGGL